MSACEELRVRCICGDPECSGTDDRWRIILSEETRLRAEAWDRYQAARRSSAMVLGWVLAGGLAVALLFVAKGAF